MKLLIPIIILFSLFSFADIKAKKQKHREQEAHVHGSGTLFIAFDGTKGKIEFKSAAEGILGFEHQPKTEKDKRIVMESISHFEKEISKMIQFDSSLNCHFTKDLIGQVPEKGEIASGEHSDWAANFTVACDKSPINSKLIIDFNDLKKINAVDITVLADSVQKSAEYKRTKRIEMDLN